MNVAIIGCGLIGRKRAASMPSGVNIIGCFDISQDFARKFALDFKCNVYPNMVDILEDSRVDFVVIATRHDSLASIATSFLQSNKHVFLEKPGAKNSLDLKTAVGEARKRNLKLHVGFNHLFHPAVLKMCSLLESGEIGKLMYLRARYGHGGRVGYENEWRSKKELSGGGELIDQGSHLIHISLKLLGDLKVDYASTPTYFWKMDVEDNAFLVLKDSKSRIAFLHASCTEWKNLFSLEVYGTTGKVEVSGLGRSYGTETLIHYRMLPEMGPPAIETWQFSEPDDSWQLELKEFISDIKNNTRYSDNTESSIKVLELIEEIYERTGR